MDRVLYNAVAKNDWSTAKWLANQGKGLQYIHVDGNTILHLAAKGNNAALVSLLIDKGADVKATNLSNQTPLFLAAYYGASVAVAELLLNAGADVNAVDKQGWTPLVAATYRSASSDLVALLLSRGADKQHAVQGGKTAIEFVLEKSDVLEQSALMHSFRISKNPIQAASAVQLAKPDLSLSRPASVRSTESPASRSATNSVGSSLSGLASSHSQSIPVSTEYAEVTTANSEQGEADVNISAVSSPSVNEGRVVVSDASESVTTGDDGAGRPLLTSPVRMSLKSHRRIFVGYNRTPEKDSTERDRVTSLVNKLTAKGLSVDVDFTPYSVSQMKLFTVSRELMATSVFVPCVSQEYMHRVLVGNVDAAYFDICAQEFSEATAKLHPSHVVPVIMDPQVLDNRTWKGPVGLMLYNGSGSEVNFTSDDLLDSAADDIVQIVAELELSTESTVA